MQRLEIDAARDQIKANADLITVGSAAGQSSL